MTPSPVISPFPLVISTEGRNLIRVLLVISSLLVGCAPAAPQGRETLPRVGIDRQGTAEALFRKGAALARAGQLVRAEQYLALVWERGYREEETLPLLLRVCLASSRLKTALGYAENRLVRHPDDWSLRYLVACIHLAMAEHGRAREQLQRVIAHRESFEPAHYLLAILLRDWYADLPAASRSFAAYLAIAPRGEHASEAAAWLVAHPVEVGAGMVEAKAVGEARGSDERAEGR